MALYSRSPARTIGTLTDERSTMNAPPILTELKLSAQMRSAINAAFESGRAIAIAYVDESGDGRKRVYDESPEFERNQDKDRKGLALIIDLDSVEGFFGGAMLRMKR